MANQIVLAFTISTLGTIFTPAQASAKLQAVPLFANAVTDPVLGQLFGLTVASDAPSIGASSATRTITLNMTSAAGAPFAPPPFPAHPITSTPPVLPYPMTRTQSLAGSFLVTNGLATVSTTASQIPAIKPGDIVEFPSQLGTFYTVLLVAAGLLTLTAPYTGKSDTTPAVLVVPAPATLAAIYSTSDRDTAGVGTVTPPIPPGSGARRVSLTYVDSTGAGPFTVTTMLRGKFPAPVVLAPGSLDIATIVDMHILTTGTFLNSVGQLTLSELASALPLISLAASPTQFKRLQDEAQRLLSRALAYVPPSYFALTQEGASGPALAGDFFVTTNSANVPTSTSQVGVLAPGDTIQFASQYQQDTPFATLDVLYTVQAVTPGPGGSAPGLVTLTRPYERVGANNLATAAYRGTPPLAAPPPNAALMAPLGQFTGSAGASPSPPPPPNPAVLSDLFAQVLSLALAVPVVPQPIVLI